MSAVATTNVEPDTEDATGTGSPPTRSVAGWTSILPSV